ncbi:MAG: HprK-related kinase B [Methylophilaceae bacterium]
MQVTSAKQIAQLLVADVTFQPQALYLNLGRCRLCVYSNSQAVLNNLEDYFSHIVIQKTDNPCDITIQVIESKNVNFPLDFYDWKREVGKVGRKDSVYDIAGARIINKVRTGMHFLQSEDYRIAKGACRENLNQVINFINNQYMTWLQQRHWLNCHAAAVVKGGYAYAVAGFSGGGKSTLMLQMLENSQTKFLSNDRLFIQQEDQQLQAVGVAKMPRINPGTIIHNPRLSHMITKSEQAQMLAMPAQTLWDLEQKYDVDIDGVYGQGRISSEAPLKSFLVLNWQRSASEPLQLKKVNLQQRTGLLNAIMKSPGPFYQQKDGTFLSDINALNQEAYLKALGSIDVFEATGRVNFSMLAEHYLMQKEI